MSFAKIRKAQQAAWPRVKESLELRKKQREKVEADWRGATAGARARARVPWNRVVSDETVWALAHEDLLATPESAAVVRAARAWFVDHAAEMDSFPEDYDESDHSLAKEIRALLAEELTGPSD